MKQARIDKIVDFIREHPAGLSVSEMLAGVGADVSLATLKRDISALLADNKLIAEGNGKATRYRLSPAYDIFAPVDLDTYYNKDADERKIKEGYNFELLGILDETPLFTAAQSAKLAGLQSQFRQNTARLTPAQYKKDMERLAIDLSWKSSQIEGNTYSLLETERLLMERETAEGKSLEEATMLINHKNALDYIMENPHCLTPLSVAKIENIHAILVKDLDVDKNIRTRRVGITGTNYRPLDNEFQIREALENACELINRRDDVFEKALLTLVLLSYIQPFGDGNKRTARIVSNAVLIAGDHCPISFRTVSSIDYKKAMLLFYERNNITAFKRIFIDQLEFAVATYF